MMPTVQITPARPEVATPPSAHDATPADGDAFARTLRDASTPSGRELREAAARARKAEPKDRARGNESPRRAPRAEAGEKADTERQGETRAAATADTTASSDAAAPTPTEPREGDNTDAAAASAAAGAAPTTPEPAVVPPPAMATTIAAAPATIDAAASATAEAAGTDDAAGDAISAASASNEGVPARAPSTRRGAPHTEGRFAAAAGARDANQAGQTAHTQADAGGRPAGDMHTASLAPAATAATNPDAAASPPGSATSTAAGLLPNGASGALLDRTLLRAGTDIAPALSNTPASAPSHAQARIDAEPGSDRFAQSLGLQLGAWVRDGVQQARLQLNPADLGPVAVQIALDGTAAQVDFHAAHARTREAIEASLPALASALRESGFTLAGGGVFGGSAGDAGLFGSAAGDAGAFAQDPGDAAARSAQRALRGEPGAAAASVASPAAAGGRGWRRGLLDVYA
ncbi:MAG: flagellar hook-length control protein FliK [Burkholderiaceae bacterium]